MYVWPLQVCPFLHMTAAAGAAAAGAAAAAAAAAGAAVLADVVDAARRGKVASLSELPVESPERVRDICWMDPENG